MKINSGCYCGKYKGIKFRGVHCDLCETIAWAVKKKLTPELKEESIYNLMLERKKYWNFFLNSTKVQTEDIVRHLEWLERRSN